MTRHVTEEEVYRAFSTIVQKLITQRPEVVAACEEVLAELMDTTQLDQKRAKLQAEQARITERVEAMMARASREVVEDFTEQYAALEAEMNRVTGKLDAVEREKGERGYRERQCRLFWGRSSQSRQEKMGRGLLIATFSWPWWTGWLLGMG